MPNPNIKKAVIDGAEESLPFVAEPKQTKFRLRVKEFRGSYKGVMFGDNGETNQAVDEEFLALLLKDWPGIDYEVID